MKKPQPNPDHRPLTLSVQREYISAAQEAYWKTKKNWNRVVYDSGFSYWCGDTYAYWELISWYYQIGRMWNKLAIPYDEFEGYMLAAKPNRMVYHSSATNIPRTPKEKYLDNKRSRYRSRWSWYLGHKDYWHIDHGVGDRERMKYRRKPQDKKKEISPEEEQKREWKKKRRTHTCLSKSGPGRYYKIKGHRAERHKSKMQLHKGDWNDYIGDRLQDGIMGEVFGRKELVWTDRPDHYYDGGWANYLTPHKRDHYDPWDWD